MIVSADVVVADDDATARELADAVRAVGTQHPHRRRRDPVPDARARPPRTSWTDDDRALVQDRLDTQFVGTPEARRRPARVLRRVTGADELLVTTITHDHADRVRSYELLADAWDGRS